MFRKTYLTLLALALALTLPLAAQIEVDPAESGIPYLPLEEILDNYYEAIGGEEAWLAVESWKLNGTMTMGPGMEAPFTVYTQRPDNYRLEFTFQGMTGIQAMAGDQAWMVMPFLGKTEPEAMPEEMAKDIKDQLDIEGALVNWASKGHNIELLGPSQIQGTDAYKLKVTLASGKEQTYYLDAEAFVPFLMESTNTMPGGDEVETETEFSEFKEVGDLMMAHSMENRVKGQPGGQVILIESVEVGTDLSDVQFAMPGAAAEQEAAE